MSAPTIIANYLSNLTVQETPTSFGASGMVTIAGLNANVILTGTTTPAVTLQGSIALTLSGGAATLDLTSFAGGLTPSDIVNATGLKVQLCKIRAPATNGAAITLAPGVSNGHNLFGAAFSVTLQPGQEISVNLANASPAIGSSSKTLGLTGTGSSDMLEMQFAFG